METAGAGKLSNGRRLVLLPLPYQGHLSPMLQLANILHSKGFPITILHTRFNSPDPTNYPHFNFVPIPDTGDEMHSLSGLGNILRLLNYINRELVDPIRECLERLMSEDDGVACLITDTHWFGTQSVCDDLKLPRIVHRTSSISSFRSFAAPVLVRDKGSVGRSNEERKSEASHSKLEPLKVKDSPKFLNSEPEGKYKILELMVRGTKQARALIWNTFKELEERELESLRKDFPIPHFLIGPFHKFFSASSSSLLTQDQTSLSWLDKHPSNSVMYVSFGSLVKVEESQFLEIAWGLANSKQPFLWVVRPGSVEGSEWLEPLPDGFLERIIEGRGYVVKWAPQQDVLSHPAIGGFWTHSGWNSTLESICEGVPMICSPSFGEQLLNARYVSDVWKIGVKLENGFERGEIESAINKVMVEEEGLEFRNKIINIKGKVNHCLKKGGSSHSSLEDLVNYMLSF